VSESWSNWAGDQSCTPLQHAHPRSTQELVEVVSGAAGAGRRVKVAGSGHSFTECALTDGLMVHLDALDRALDCDGELVKVQAGIVLARLNEVLAEHGRAMENLGDIDKQTLAGAISTATHGTGALLPNISAQVAAIELVSGEGKVVELTAESDPDGLRAARVGLGALGALSAVTLRTVPAFKLHRVDEVRAIDDVLAGFEHDIAANDHYEFFVFPYARNACTVRRNRTDAPAKPRGAAARLVNEWVLGYYLADGLLRLARRLPALIPRVNRVAAPLMSEGDYIEASFRVFSSERRFRFTEMEYALPREHGPEMVRRVLDWVEQHRFPTAFPLECRVVAADDAFLSPSFERDTVYVAVHQYKGMQWQPYFDAVEAIAAEYGGRPHWGKRHGLTSTTLAERYPRFGEFLAVRDRLDPGRTFASDYTARCLGP
jgi:L-gulono-1,4-lactone dehydrogenase